tara:strand:+ start:5989 stop:7068 length:1080 start_codon:yes stop_codon:yes gene_type:complete
MADPSQVMLAAAQQVPLGRATEVRGKGSHTSVAIRKFPQNLAQDESDTKNFVMFYVKPGGPGNRGSSGLSGTSSLIALHIPPGALKTSFEGKYEEFRGGRVFEQGLPNLAAVAGPAALSSLVTKSPIIAGISAVLGGVAKGISDTGSLDPGIVFKQTVNNLGDAGGSIATLAVGGAASGGLLNPLKAGMGFAINPHSSLIYQGPGAFRTHDFSFDFWPRSYQEAIEVAGIVQTFKEKMLPKMKDFWKLKSVYFGFPHEFHIDFYIKTDGGTKEFSQMGIKRSVLTKMNVNFDGPQGPAFYDPPEKGQEPMPVHTKLDLVFQETEFILEYEGKTTDLQNYYGQDFRATDDDYVHGKYHDY